MHTSVIHIEAAALESPGLLPLSFLRPSWMAKRSTLEGLFFDKMHYQGSDYKFKARVAAPCEQDYT